MRSSSSNYEERQPDRLRASAGVPFGVFPAYFSLPPILYWWEGFFMKGRWFLAFLLTALAGSALHFAYDLCPSPLVGLFCPVSESVWEHLKLLYAPFLVCGFVLKPEGSRYAGGMERHAGGASGNARVSARGLLYARVRLFLYGRVAEYHALCSDACAGLPAFGKALPARGSFRGCAACW